ncbi:MAG: class I SAM-dependent methyltransferase [Bacteroidia bacterium]
MQDRHSNREQYFKEQGLVTGKYVVPYIGKYHAVTANCVVAEIGCGEAGNMMPFLDLGCKVVGVDLSESKIENGKKFFASHPNTKNITLIAENIYNVTPEEIGQFDLVVMRDTIEHIPDQEKFLGQLKLFLKPGAHVYFGFPPWSMPYGGHQQVCRGKFISKMPWTHLLPRGMYKGLLKMVGESEGTIQNLMEVYDTGISTRRFRKAAKMNGYRIDDESLYFINPNYEIKFGLKPRRLFPLFNIPMLRDFFSTTAYYIISVEKN